MGTEPSVLIVDDDPRVRRTLSDILRAKGYSPLGAETGKAALARVEEERPAVALIDLKLEDMSGLEVIRQIKERSANTECIVITGYATQASAIEAINVGAYSYVQKPYDMEQLLVTIRRAIEKRGAEEALRRSEERYRALVESINDVIFTLDAQGRFTYISPAITRISHYGVDEVAGQPSSHFVHPEDRAAWLSSLERTLGGQVEPREFRMLDRDGSLLHIHTSSRQLLEDGQLVGVAGIMTDITERKRAEEALREREEQLLQAQKMEAVGRLAGGVAHDFNNLLTAITGYSQLLLSDLAPDDARSMDAQEILKAAERAASLTRQLLAFSRRQMLQPQVLDLNAVVANIDRMLGRLIGEDIELVAVLEPGLRRVKADPGQVEQVIMNLAVNARDAMPRGGILTIKTENVSLGEEHCALMPEARPGSFVCLSVMDTGVGMDAQTVEHIFEPFFTTKEQGTGLGLSVVYGIVQQHEGWIDVYSEPGQGSTLKVYLPAFSVEAQDEGGEKISLERPRGTGEGILLVEDEAGLREFVVRVLGENGYVVFEAANAEEALKVFQRARGKIHLVFSDVVLPDATGLQLVDQLLSGEPELAVLMSSGYADEKSHWSGIRERGFEFIEKPYGVPELLRAVRGAVEAS